MCHLVTKNKRCLLAVILDYEDRSLLMFWFKRTDLKETYILFLCLLKTIQGQLRENSTDIYNSRWPLAVILKKKKNTHHKNSLCVTNFNAENWAKCDIEFFEPFSNIFCKMLSIALYLITKNSKLPLVIIKYYIEWWSSCSPKLIE